MELSALPYDINSVMHFGDRDYSKNGHRTIMFKDPNMKQNKVGLTHMDLRKIDAVYGPECRTRDRQEKLDLCQSYPGVARRKREARPDEVEPAKTTVEAIAEEDIKLDKEGKNEGVEVFSNTGNVKSGPKNEGGDENVEVKDIKELKSGDLDKQDKNVVSEKKDIKIDVTQSLRINPNITPPPHVRLISLNAELGIADGLQDLVDDVFNLSKLALNNAREKYCFNKTVGIRPSTRSTETNATDTDILGIVDLVVKFVNGMVNHAKSNLTQFCLESESIDRYSRYGCNYGNGRDCPQTYRSTKSGPVRHSTQHRPTYFQSTKMPPRQKNIFDHHNEGFRKKRNVEVEAITEQLKKGDDKVNNDSNNNVHKAQDGNSGNDTTEISNRDGDPPPHVQLITLNAELGIADGLQDLVDNVFKLSKLALNNAREKYCFNNTVGIRPSTRSTETNATDTDILGIVDLVVQYVTGMVNHAKTNLTQFCLESESIDRYSRYGCNSGDGRECPKTYRSTKSGPVQHSTQHRPTYFQSTKIPPRQKNIFDHHNEGFRKKRNLEVEAITEQLKKVDDKVNNDSNNDVHKAQDGNSGNDSTEISNRDGDPPPHVQLITLNAELGIADGLQDLVDNVFKLSKLALNNAREKYCFNNIVGVRPSTRSTETNATDTDILGIVDLVVQYVTGMVNHAKTNLTQFCLESESIDRYSRYGCNSGDGRECPKTYRSTKSGPVQHSTQHRPTYFQSTKIPPRQRNIFDHHNEGFRKKRSVDVEAVTEQLNKVDDKVKDKVNNDSNNDVHKAQDGNSGNDTTEISNRDVNDGAFKRNDEKNIDSDGMGKIVSNNETRGEKNEVEVKMKNENEAEAINQAEEMKNGTENKKDEEKLTLKVDDQPIRRRDIHYRRNEYESSVSGERDRNQKYMAKQPSSEVDERQKDPRQYKDELERIEREKVEEEQLKYRLELKKQRDKEYDKKFLKHLPEWSNEVALIRDEDTTKRAISIYNTDRNAHKVKNTLTSAENSNERNIKRVRDRNENPRTADRNSDLKWSQVKKLEPIETYERERENKKYGDIDNGKYHNNNKDTDAEYDKFKEYDEGYKRPEKTYPKKKKYDDEETEYKRPEKTIPKVKKYDVQSESVENETEEKRMTTKKGRQMMKKMKKKSDRDSDKRKEQQSVEDEIANREEQPSDKQSKEVSRMKLPRLVKLSKANEEFYKDRRWPGGEVRYHIQEDTTYDTEDLRSRIEEVNDILKEKTCVYLKELTADEATEYEDYLVIDNSPDYVTGRVGGRQKFGSIELFRGGQHRQHTAMMVMAWLGFYFEVSRHDRDKYVRVHMRHIRPDKLHHFEKIRGDATLNLPYDYESATHPAWQYWRQIGRKGISTVATYKHKDPDGTIMKSMGQNEKLLSDIDIVKINSVYGLSCKRNERAKERAKEKAKTREEETKMKQEPDTSSSDGSSSSTEDSSE